MSKLTQKQKILEMLESGNWISTVQFVQAFILRAAARLHELRKEGHNIESRKVGGKTYEEYRLVKDNQPVLL